MSSPPNPVAPAANAQGQEATATQGAQAYESPRILWEQPYVALARSSPMTGCDDPEFC